MIPQRHDLVFIAPSTRFSIHSLHHDSNTIQKEVVAWLKKGFPCIYTRQSSDDAISLGVSLFFNNKKYRVGLSVDKSAVLRRRPLPTLVEMQEFFFHYYGIEGLDTLSTGVAVYGSFLFQYLSKDLFVNKASDLDVLIPYSNFSLMILDKLISNLSKKFNRTIDGEIRFATLGDISINELLNVSAETILCKTRNNVEMISRAKLHEIYPLL